LKDLRAMLQYVGDNAKDSPWPTATSAQPAWAPFSGACCKLASATIFGEPMLDINDFMQTVDGKASTT
jgi:hypothetical protein